MSGNEWKWLDDGDLEAPNGELHLFIKGALRDGIIDVLNAQEDKIVALRVELELCKKELETEKEENDLNEDCYESLMWVLIDYLDVRGLREDYLKWVERRKEDKE